jgi:hypothetical protein
MELQPRHKVLLLFHSVGTSTVRGVLGNKCAGQHNLKTIHFKETIVSGNIWPWSSAICGFFCSALSTTGRWWRAFL